MSSSLTIGQRARLTAIPEAVLSDAENSPEILAVFQNALGNTYTIRGFNNFGFAEIWLSPDGREEFTGGKDSIWVEPEFLSPLSAPSATADPSANP